MVQYLRSIVKARSEDEGASAVEYGLLVAAIAALIVIIVFALGGLVRDVFKSTCDNIATSATTVTQTGNCNTN